MESGPLTERTLNRNDKFPEMDNNRCGFPLKQQTVFMFSLKI